MAVAGLVAGQAQGADQAVRGRGQRRFGVHDTGAVEQFVRHAVLAQHRDVLGGGVELGLVRNSWVVPSWRSS